MKWALLRMLRCESVAPLGKPVVPEGEFEHGRHVVFVAGGHQKFRASSSLSSSASASDSEACCIDDTCWIAEACCRSAAC